jgi:hypothetical protein
MVRKGCCGSDESIVTDPSSTGTIIVLTVMLIISVIIFMDAMM